ncbi:hypothetical protein [Polaribacter sp.]|uniref:hypothetical protein n=1 Tax=Polaribacter sp. TaxID=1920175 RepID=UPI003F6C4421
MNEKIKRLKASIKEKESLVSQIKAIGDDNRAFKLFCEVQKLKTELSLANKYLKLK